MNNIAGALGVLFFIAILGFIGFVIYFIFKQMEFVIKSINLYEKMIIRHDTMIKLLFDIRDSTKDAETDKAQSNDPLKMKIF